MNTILPYKVAGHTFEDVVDPVCLVCGRPFAAISHVTTANVGEPDLAHVGVINMQEVEEVWRFNAYRDEKKERIHSAIYEVGKAG
jgi:hypothetical protein